MRKAITVVYYVIVGFLIARVIVSWVPALQKIIIGEIVYAATDPVFAPLQRIIPPIGGIDITVILVWFALSFVYRWLMERVR